MWVLLAALSLACANAQEIRRAIPVGPSPTGEIKRTSSPQPQTDYTHGLNFPTLFIILVVATVAVRYILRARHRKRLTEQFHQYIATIQKSGAFPIVATNIILKPGEAAFYSAPSVLYETRAVRHYQSSHAGVRVMKGLWVGGTSGRSISTQEWAKIDAGWLTITNKRLVFEGQSEERSVLLSKILSVQPRLTQIELAVEGRQKAMVFEAANGMIASLIIRLCCQVSDPLNLSDDNLIARLRSENG